MYLGQIVEKGKADEVYNNPKHPYTKALISSVPIQHPHEVKERIALEGSMPSAVDLPSGCRFNTRCPYKTERCIIESPTRKILDNGTEVACHLY